MLQDRKLNKNNYEGIYLKCLGCKEAREVLEQYHDKYGTRHGSAEVMTHHILWSSYLWPIIFNDTFEHVCSYHTCQTSAKKEINPSMPLQLVFEVYPFAKWGLNFIGPINPPSSTGHMFVLIAINYCKCLIEAKKFQKCTNKVVIDFLEEHIVTRFGMPFFLVYNNGSSFMSIFFSQWALGNQLFI